MSDRKAMEMALEALESLFNWQVDHERGKRCGDAVAALRAALEQSPALAIDELQPVYEEGCRAGRKAALDEVTRCLAALVETIGVWE